MENITIVPFTDKEIKNINEWQESGVVHNLTCPNGCDTLGEKLFAIELGLFCPHCDSVVQQWVPNTVADGGGLNAAKKMMELLQPDKSAPIEKGFNGLTDAETERLAILIEECAEVQQIACKILRHGYDSHNPTVVQGADNRRLLETEVGDLLFSIEWLQQVKDIDGTKVRYAAIDKKQKVQKYLHHNTI